MGSSFAGYRVERLIARGGMGEVYAARHDVLDRVDALKLLRSEFADDAVFRERFLREAHLAASVRHPAVVPVYTAGEVAGRLYLAMLHVEGSDLREVLARRAPLPPEEVIEILVAVAGALDAAHRKGLVHRDVKPGNILIAEPEPQGRLSSGEVYLTDFGITRIQARATSTLTKEGGFLGSVGYVAPEQISGLNVDGRTDLYSLACVAFECLTGDLPFPFQEQPAMLAAHLHRPPPRARDRARHLPPAVDDVLLGGLAKNPDDRPATCLAFAQLLATALSRAPGSGHLHLEDATFNGAAPPAPVPRCDLGVTGGPLAGSRMPLPTGRHVVGRGEQADIRLADQFLSRAHLVFEVPEDGPIIVRDNGSANGSLVDGEPLSRARALGDGHAVEAGASLLEVLPHLAPATATPGPDAALESARRREIGPTPPPEQPARGWRRGRRAAASGTASLQHQKVLQLRADHPDAVELLARIAGGPGPLWSRRPGDELFLDLRIGFGRVGPTTSTSGARSEALPAVPLHVDLRRTGGLVVRGDRGLAEACARWLVVQAATLSGPDELDLAVALPSFSPLDWSWVSLLPHVHHGRLGVGPAWSADRTSTLAMLEAVREASLRSPAATTAPRARRPLLLISDAEFCAQLWPGSTDGRGIVVAPVGTASLAAKVTTDASTGSLTLTTDGEAAAGTPDGLSPTLAREAALGLSRLSI